MAVHLSLEWLFCQRTLLVNANINLMSFLTLGAGEVLGISGLLGSGRTSLAKALFGLVRADSGEIKLADKTIPLGDPIAATQAGIGYVPEDRLTEGLFLTQSIVRNVAVGRLDSHTSKGFLNLPSLAVIHH